MKNLIVVLMALALFSQCTSKQEVAQWRGPERNGIYPDTNLLTEWPKEGPQLLWRFDSLGPGYASVAATSEKIYTIGTNDSISYVYAFSKTGEILWKKSLGKEWMINWPGMRSTPLVYNGLGYVLNGFGQLFCFDAENGNTKWTKDIVKDFKTPVPEFGLCENLLADGDMLFCTTASSEALVVALDRKNGDLIWKSAGFAGDSTSYASPILINWGGKKFFINETKKALFSVDASTGKLAWRHEINGWPISHTPVFRDGYLFSVDVYKSGSMMLKLADDGMSYTEVWRNKLFAPQQGDVVVLGERMYGASDKRFICVDWKTGNEIYSDSARSEIINVIAADKLLYLYMLRGGGVSLYEPTDTGIVRKGSTRILGGTVQLHCSHPVIKDGVLYIRHDNSLFAYDVAKK